MKKKFLFFLIVIASVVKGQMLEENILKTEPIRWHKSYINFPSLGYSMPNSAVRTFFGSGLFFSTGYAWYIKKTSRLGLGIYSQIAVNLFAGNGSESFFIGSIAGYKLSRKTSLEAKLLIGPSTFNPPDKMLKQMGYHITSNGSMTIRYLLGFNLRQKIAKRCYLLAGIDINMGKVNFTASEDDNSSSAAEGNGSGHDAQVTGQLNYTSIYLGLAIILH